MRITKAQLRKIIKEEKARLISEMNPDGTVSPDEGEDEEDLLMHAGLQIDELIQYIKDEADRIGGGFRGPGVKARALKMIADKIYRAR
tara:strand:+ start:444 stop:707 length:264 start_codon:yes stop_codon:yes gene_type:complete